MADDTKPQPEHERFDPAGHAALKQALRDKDREDLRLGRATAEEIHKRNLFLGQVDMSRARILNYGPHSGTKAPKARRKSLRLNLTESRLAAKQGHGPLIGRSFSTSCRQEPRS